MTEGKYEINGVYWSQSISMPNSFAIGAPFSFVFNINWIQMDIKDKLKYYQSEKKQVLPEKEHRIEDIAKVLGGSILENETLPVIKIERFEKYTDIDPTISNQSFSSVNLTLLTKKQFREPLLLEDFLIFF